MTRAPDSDNQQSVMLAALMLLALPAQPNVEEARTYFEAGQEAYRAGLYLEAAAAFEKANKLVPTPAITFSIAQSYRLHYFVKQDPTHLRLAIDAYGRYLREVEKGGRRADALEHMSALEATLARIESETKQPVIVQPQEQPTRLMITSQTEDAKISIDGSAPAGTPLTKVVEPGEHKVIVEAAGHFSAEKKLVAVESELIAQEITLVPKPATVTVDAPPGADVRVDGRLVGVAPLGGPLELEAGKHTVVVSSVGAHPSQTSLDVARGEITSVAVELDSTLQRTISYWLLGIGGAAFVVTGVVVGVALGSEARARVLLSKLRDDEINLTRAELQEYIDSRDRRNDLLAASTAGLVGGVLFAGIGGLLYFLDSPDLSDVGIGTEITPMVGPGSAGLSYTTSF